MNRPKIIAVVGMAGSGKGTCTDFLGKAGFPVVHFGHMVYDEVARRGLDNVLDERYVRQDMRRLEGPAVLAIRAAKQADEHLGNGAQAVVFDGLYSWDEYLYVQEKYADEAIFIATFTPKALRYERVVARRDGKRVYTREQIVARDHAEIEDMNKGGPIAMADHTIINAGPVEELTGELVRLLGALGVEVPDAA